jgi:hypothetical protein
MSDVPKIVQDRLRAAVPTGAHPDADTLAAFAEQALAAAEREGVVQHLARCRDCREVVALSLPPVEAVAGPQAAADGVSARKLGDVSRAWFAWPTLRWAAIAAAVVVVASVVLLRPGKQPSVVEVASQQAEKNVPSTAVVAQPAAPLADQAAPSVASRMAKRDSSTSRERPMLRMIEPQPGRVQTQTAAGSASQLADNKRTDSLEGQRSYSVDADKLPVKVPAAPVAGAQGEMAASEQITGSSQEVVVVGGASNVAENAPAENKLRARAETSAPIVKAKSAAKEEAQLQSAAKDTGTQEQLKRAFAAPETNAAVLKAQSKAVPAQWSLAQGVLRRSLDGGATWQTALQLGHPLLCFGARGNDVWAGGQAGALFHSSDAGATWTMVQPSTQTASLTADIVALEIRSPVEIGLTTSNNESWSTPDAGKTWEKK